MKTNTNFLKTALLLITIITSIACNKPASTPGPEGVIGKTGAQGIQGAVGAKGDKGDAGTANVYYSDWINITFTGSSGNYESSINAPKITQEILDKGIILMYIKVYGNIYSLPYAYASSLSALVSTILPKFALGKIFLYSSYNLSGPVRYVIIPGGIPIGQGRKQALQSMSYEEVKVLYNIKD